MNRSGQPGARRSVGRESGDPVGHEPTASTACNDRTGAASLARAAAAEHTRAGLLVAPASLLPGHTRPILRSQQCDAFGPRLASCRLDVWYHQGSSVHRAPATEIMQIGEKPTFDRSVAVQHTARTEEWTARRDGWKRPGAQDQRRRPGRSTRSGNRLQFAIGRVLRSIMARSTKAGLLLDALCESDNRAVLFAAHRSRQLLLGAPGGRGLTGVQAALVVVNQNAWVRGGGHDVPRQQIRVHRHQTHGVLGRREAPLVSGPDAVAFSGCRTWQRRNRPSLPRWQSLSPSPPASEAATTREESARANPDDRTSLRSPPVGSTRALGPFARGFAEPVLQPFLPTLECRLLALSCHQGSQRNQCGGARVRHRNLFPRRARGLLAED